MAAGGLRAFGLFKISRYLLDPRIWKRLLAKGTSSRYSENCTYFWRARARCVLCSDRIQLPLDPSCSESLEKPKDEQSVLIAVIFASDSRAGSQAVLISCPRRYVCDEGLSPQ